MGRISNGLGPGSGRPPVTVDLEAALDLLGRGEKIPAIATELGCSAPTLRSRIADLSKKQGLLLRYREIQSLQLTELQARVLEAITPEKIESASLRDLVLSYKILKDKEQVIEGKPSEIKGLVAHLIHLEKMEKNPGDSSLDAEFSDAVPEDQQDTIFTDISQLDDMEF